MKRRVLATCLTICLLTSLLPTVAMADNVSLDLANDSITITETGYSQGTSGEETFYIGEYSITSSRSTSNTITIASGTIDMTISGLDVKATDAPAIYIEAGTTLKLTVEGVNTLTGGPGFAAICVEPAYDKGSNYDYDANASAKLYISGSGNLTVKGGDGDATSGTYGGGAGIGGNGEDQQGGDGVDFGLIHCVHIHRYN